MHEALDVRQKRTARKIAMVYCRLENEMQGLKYVTNESGKRVAVMIDRKKHGELWEDFYDGLIAKKREDEPRESLESVKKLLERKGKFNG